MLSRTLLREQAELVRERLNARGIDGDPTGDWTELDRSRREVLSKIETLKHQRNTASKDIGRVKQSGGDASEAIAKVGELKKEIEDLASTLEDVEQRLEQMEGWLPNLPDPSTPIGPDESANRLERKVGEPHTFDFEPKAHWDLGPDLGILDFERAAEVTGARFVFYRGAGARLERALINFMLDLQTGHGYEEVIPPFIVHERSLVGTGQLPKFADDLFHLAGTSFYMVPTAEVPLTNFHRGEILNEEDLPLRFAAYTPCFRAEAGSHGKDVRGLIRQHQFNKVELVQLSAAEKSFAALEELVGHAERVLQLLELPYQVMCLSTGDMGFATAKTYDLEVWLPGQNAYREISSCSNCTDFQARRANIRYRSKEDGKTHFVHTLNGSGLAVGRTLVAVLENYQQADGSVVVPDALRPYMGGVERIAGSA